MTKTEFSRANPMDKDIFATLRSLARQEQFLEVVDRDDESGWLWCRSADGREGWVPSRSVEATAGPESG